MSFIAELRARKVFRVTAVYIVVAWVAIQAASIALPAFDAPVWTLRVVILLFALGLPVAMLLTWALELTPEGVRLASGKVGNKRIATISVALAALALGWYFLGQPALRGDAAAVPERSIAVLPFVNMSGNPANEYFSDGLAETTLDMLAQVPDLKVIARTSSFAFKGKPTDMREIGRQLGTAHLLEGSVQQAGDTVRITVQLIRTADGSHLWSQRFDRRMTDVFHIQDEIATAVVSALQLKLPESAQRRLVRRRTEDVGAYQEYLKGIALMPRRNVPEMRRALQHFEQAIRLDPRYARAYVGAHDALHLLGIYSGINARQQAQAEQYLARALELAPDLGEAHAARGSELESAGDYYGAEAEYRRAVQLAPGYATAHQWLGELLGLMGRFDEAVPYMRRARELDPLSPVVAGTSAFVLGQAGRVDEALAIDNALIASHPDVARTYDDRSSLHQFRGDLVATLRDLRVQDRLDPAAVGFRSHRCHALMDFGALAEAGQCLDALARLSPASPPVRMAQARLAALQGRPEEALALLDGIEPPPRPLLGPLLVSLGRDREALDLYRPALPRAFGAGPPQVYPGEAFEALYAGTALLRSSDEARGRAVLEAAIDAVAERPYTAMIAGRGWLEVAARAQLGDPEGALAALQRGVDAGLTQWIAQLDADPLLAGLRADPRFERILAPARAQAAAQVRAARDAGLL